MISAFLLQISGLITGIVPVEAVDGVINQVFGSLADILKGFGL